MKNVISSVLLGCLLSLSVTSMAQENEAEVIKILDDLRTQWDTEAVKMETYEGLKQYCRNRPYRDNMILLLKQIHHYDSSLYDIVITKYQDKEDPEAKATLADIETLEIEYTTKSFMRFLRNECMEFNNIEMNKNSANYEAYKEELETELFKYVEGITRQIDVIDDHAHHLTGI